MDLGRRFGMDYEMDSRTRLGVDESRLRQS
jgi:hypothetical protein